MCDTQTIITSKATWFAKNSDREPGEAQHIVRIPPVECDPKKIVNTTYMEIPQCSKRYGVILSQPFWMWGAEMGVNDQGVAIGNEAVFTRLLKKKGQALLGMDLVRLGLERSSCADEALSVITRLLDCYGQGGPAGYRDATFRYDNSFIIADAKKTWVLETAGSWWVAKKIEHFGAISNALTIGKEFDLAKTGLEDYARKQGYTRRFETFNFAKAFDSFLLPFFGAAKFRQRQSTTCLSKIHANNSASFKTMIANLRQHHHEQAHFKQHSNRDICMHAASLLRPSQTCASMVVELVSGQAPQIMMTGTSAPCLSLFKPIDFNFDRALHSEQRARHREEKSLWQRFEAVHRQALQDHDFCQRLKISRDSMEGQIFSCIIDDRMDVSKADRLAEHWHRKWEKRAAKTTLGYSRLHPYQRFWQGIHRQDPV